MLYLPRGLFRNLVKNFYFIFLINCSCFSQTIQVDYKAFFIAEPKTEGFSQQEVGSVAYLKSKLAISVEREQISLIANDTSFVLSLENQLPMDDFSMSSAVGQSILNLHNYVYATDVDSVFGFDLRKNYIVRYNKESVNWRVTSETKDIAGYKCYKALPNYLEFSKDQQRGLPTAAWFTPDLEQIGGPIVYIDLPGLVLEVESKLTRISASSVKETDVEFSIPSFEKKVISYKTHLEINSRSYQMKKSRGKN